ncbi:MAG: Lon protease family protein [Elusimicrobiota bacterium]
MPVEDNKLKPKMLKNTCDPEVYSFETTEELETGTVLIDQEKALNSIDFGLNMHSKGYNLYVSGITGTGRNTAVNKKVNEIAQQAEVPDDICYLYNFENPDTPKALKLPAGTGCKLKNDMEEFIEGIQGEVKKSFSSSEYEKNKEEFAGKINKKKEQLLKEIEKEAKAKGFALRKTISGIVVIALNDENKPMNEDEYKNLSEEEKMKLEEKQKDIYDRINSTTKKIKKFQKKFQEELENLDKKIVMYAIKHHVDDLKEGYEEFDRIIKHIEKVVDDILNNIDFFKKDEDKQKNILVQNVGKQNKDILQKYKVNVLVDHCQSKGAPVINEDHPIYHNLVGKVEHQQKQGVLTTDFTMIKPGSIHKANGGYLIIQAMDLLRDFFSWDALKRIIRYGQVKIESLQQRYGLLPTATLKPEPLEVDLKIIIVGNPLIYQLLYKYDEDFKKLFKVKVDFDSTMKRTKKTLKNYGNFVAQQCSENNLLPFRRDAVAGIVDYSSRMSVHKEKLTARFVEIADIIKEADYWTRRSDAKIVTKSHINKAIEEKIFRSNMIEKKIQELIEENTLMVEAEGKKTAQINGLSILDLGDYMFGKPSRITARTYLGDGKIVNIEREADMSGKIHSKGIMSLTGFIGEKFGRDKPLAFSASITFEQIYEEIDGDSASSAELYCLLSSLADIPLRQDLAVTGSVNQKGEIQPIGGVNQKIEGFFDVCKIKNLSGSQGVLIPSENVKHLMLKDEVIEAVKNDEFNIYSVQTIEEGIEILSGKKAQEVYKKVNRQLEKYAETAAKYLKGKNSTKAD